MNRSEWAERLPLIQAFVEGKTIQCYDTIDNVWVDGSDLAFDSKIKNYRIKPEPKVIWVNEYEIEDFDCWEHECDAVRNAGGNATRVAVKYVEVIE